MKKDFMLANADILSSDNCCAASAAASNEASNLYQVNLVEPTGQESFYTITRMVCYIVAGFCIIK